MGLFSFPERVNERAARLVASVVATSLVGAWAMDWGWALPVLCLGFVLRWAWGPRFSPLGRGAVWLASRLWEVRLVAGPPKRFAQGIGAVCLFGASALWFADIGWLAWAMAGMVAGFATIEAALGFCMGCWLYRHLPERQGGDAVCEECVVPRGVRAPENASAGDAAR